MADTSPDEHVQPELPFGQTDDAPTPAQTPASVADALGALRTTNQEKYRALLRMGEVPNPSSVIAARLEALIDLLLGDEAARLGLDYNFENRMTTLLHECLAQARQKQLTVPAPDAGKLPPSLILPGQ